MIFKMLETNVEPIEVMFANTLREYIKDKKLVYNLYQEFKNSPIDITMGNQFIFYLKNDCIDRIFEENLILYQILGYDGLEAAFYTDYILQLMHSVMDIKEISVEEYQQIMDDIKENWVDYLSTHI